MISIVWSMNVDKSNTLYCDVICKVIKCYYSNIKHRQNVCFVSWCSYKVIKCCYSNSRHRQNTYFALLLVTVPNNYYYTKQLLFLILLLLLLYETTITFNVTIIVITWCLIIMLINW